ncbi:TspO/MBR family protein [uncultured archaeon]|nr:TspO/MBR family protein [uncultured archaeon]
MKKRGKKKLNKKVNWKILITSFIVVYAAAFIGSIFTSQGVNSDWYQSVKPVITPPNWVFPVVWNILFFLIFVSLYASLVSARKKILKLRIGVIFGINFILNILWSVLYFGLKNPLLAYFDLLLLMISILSMIFIIWKINRKASWLLVPYFLWVGFAGILNYLSAFR